jgi:hypothetical protein
VISIKENVKMKYHILVFGVTSIMTVIGIPFHSSQSAYKISDDNDNGIDKLRYDQSNTSNSDKNYRKQWDGYWEAYYRNLMDKLEARTYEGNRIIFIGI